MKKLIAGVEAIVEVIDSVESVAEALENMRQNTTDDEWGQICSNPHVDALVGACMDREALI